MLNDYSIYIDPEEDEVFFTAFLDRPIITVSKPNNSLADSSDEDIGIENVFINKDVEADSNICPSPDIKLERKGNISKEDEICMDNNSENEVTTNRNKRVDNYNAVSPNQSVNNLSLQENEFSVNRKEIIENKPDHSKTMTSPFTSPLKSTENLKKSSILQSKNNYLLEDKENFQCSVSQNLKQDDFKTPFKKSPLKSLNAKSSSKKKNDLSFAKMCDSSRISDFELNADINESIISWSSVDVNVQLENLMADLDFDEESLEEESFCLSSTPQKVGNEPQLEFKWTRTGLDVRLGEEIGNTPKQTDGAGSEAVPSINIIDSTPVEAPTKSPTRKHFQKPMMPFRLVYSSGKKSVGRSGSSGSSSDSQPFATPRSTPLTAAKTSFHSNIPKLSAKKVATKSLQFPHIESPISKYLYDKSTPLMNNVKSQKVTSSNLPARPAAAAQVPPKPAVAKLLPQARYQKGIPMRQEIPLLSKLPRLGANQMRVVSAVPSAKVISHSPRRADVSVLMSSPAKINPKH